MTDPLKLLYDLEANALLSLEDCEEINIFLASAPADSVSRDQASNVVAYLDSQLLHNDLDLDLADRLESLREKLGSRV